MRKTNKLMAIVLSCVMALSVLLGAQNVSAAEFSASKAEMEVLLKECYDSNPAEENFAYGNEWHILNYARSGAVTEAQKKAYCDSVVETLKSSEKTSFDYASENAKVVLILNAMKCDPANMGGYNLVEPLKNEASATADMYGLMYAMLALYSTDANASFPAYVDKLLTFQKASGGFDGYGFGEDPDSTAMAIQALAPFYNKDTRVKSAVDAGVTYLASQMDSGTGAIVSWGTPNSNSTAQVILALTGLGMNPTKDARFCANGKNLIQALYGFYCGKGEFGYDNATTANALASVQSVQAMIAYHRLLNGQTTFYDMSDLRQPAVHQYPVLEGASQTVDVTKEGTLSIRIDCPIEKFVGVEMDGVTVDPKYYTVTSGSTIVTFISDYVKTLKAGAHAVTVNFTDGSATVDVTVAKKNNNPAKKPQTNTTTAQQGGTSGATQEVKSPKTGEEFPVAMCVMMVLMAGAVVYAGKRA
ncbi:MAG: terpene cyclase/mutase family protein [Lachnospiraceae bacterium]|nr:terpene cyclase/mutase family protein [Lachnospiraceae bacterium]